jgi:tRNA pseudouridine38-40 synthase
MTDVAPTSLRTLKLTIAYDGTDYAGWQSQRSSLPTVQETLEAALEKITGRHVPTLASGRTDAGVHALAQVIGFSTDSALPPEVFVRALNANLPRDIAVLDAAEAPDGFHPTHHAVRKRYRYVIFDGAARDVFQRRYVWHYAYGRLDAEAMHRAAAALLGRHDFRSFESSGARRGNSVRTIFDIRVERGRGGQFLPSPFGRGAGGEGDGTGLSPFVASTDDFILLEVEADGFLYNMVRAIVGTLVPVGSGKRPESWPGDVLAAMDRSVAGATAPPQGLFLVKVEY